MKKSVSFILAAVLAVSLAACGSPGSSSKTESSPAASSSENPSSSESDEGTTPSAEESTEEKSEANSQEPVSGIENSLEEMIAQVYEHTSKLYTDGLVTQTIDMTDADTVQFLLGLTSAEGVNPLKWVCVGAEKVITASYGNYILLVMSSEEIAADVYEAFRTAFGEDVSEAISRSNLM